MSILFVLGKTWNHVWGHLSDEYSRMVIRNYLCKTEIDVKATRELPQLTFTGLYAMHKGGVNFRTRPNPLFGMMVERMYRSCKFMCILVIIFL